MILFFLAVLFLLTQSQVTVFDVFIKIQGHKGQIKLKVCTCKKLKKFSIGKHPGNLTLNALKALKIVLLVEIKQLY